MWSLGLVVWKQDRLGRSLKHLIDLVTGFREKGIEFISLNDSINTTTVQARLTFNIFASFAEFERELIRERTMAGLQKHANQDVYEALKKDYLRKPKSSLCMPSVMAGSKAEQYRKF